MRAPVLDALETAFSNLGYKTLSEKGAKELVMTHDDGSRMTAEASEGSDYGYLQVNKEHLTILLIRLGTTGPYITPHRLEGQAGCDLLWQLIETCEPFRKDWLGAYLDEVYDLIA